MIGVLAQGARVVALAAAASVGVAAAPAAAQTVSEYSSIKVEDCLLSTVDPLGAAMVCPGVRGFNVIVGDFDVRIYFSLVSPNWTEVADFPTTAVVPSFSAVGSDVVEWRVRDGEVRGFIARLRVSPPEGAEFTTLLVARVDPAAAENTCLVGAVQGGSGANEEARRLADAAEGMPCL